MTIPQDYLSALPISELEVIIADFEVLHRDHQIGNCALRRHAAHLVATKLQGAATIHVMQELGLEAYRLLALHREAEVRRLRVVMARAASIIEANLYHQREKVSDAAMLLKSA